jgi:hypothetical protein
MQRKSKKISEERRQMVKEWLQLRSFQVRRFLRRPVWSVEFRGELTNLSGKRQHGSINGC